MRKMFIIFFVCLAVAGHTQTTTSGKVLWAFPITDYMVPLNDTINVVQVILPPHVTFVKDKQFGLTHGISRGADVDTGTKGFGRCHLIKGQFNYFSISMVAGKKLREGDLVYTFIPAIQGNYQSPLFFCASHNISFLNVEDTPFYKPADFLKKRTKLKDSTLITAMVADIQRTGRYFLESDTSMNKPIEDGPYKGGRILEVMAEATQADVISFLEYVVARPRRYAGNNWKVSETFATWLLAGAPMVIKD